MLTFSYETDYQISTAFSRNEFRKPDDDANGELYLLVPATKDIDWNSLEGLDKRANQMKTFYLMEWCLRSCKNSEIHLLAVLAMPSQ